MIIARAAVVGVFLLVSAFPGNVMAGLLCGFSQVSAGGGHTCGIRPDGTVTCWGFNRYGKANPPTGAFTQVSAGEDHTCGVRADGTVACWGSNRYQRANPPTGAFTQVSAGSNYTCGLGLDGTVECWGSVRIPRFSACDSDGDGILDDGDDSGEAGDRPCTRGNTSMCDDNCPAAANADQADGDRDGAGDACDAAFNCTSTPRSACLRSSKSVLRIEDKRPAGPSRGDALDWMWAKGPAVTQADFGNPTTTASYALCIYTGAALALEINVPGGASWSAIGTTGYKFDDPTLAQDGTRSIKEKGGAAGKSLLYHQGKGSNLPLTPSLLPLDTSRGVLVQVHNSDSDTCWEASFSAAGVRKNTGKLFRANLP